MCNWNPNRPNRTIQTREHALQSKLLELFLATLSGCTYLQDISRGSAALDQDLAVAQAWGQERWADYSGVSRTLKACAPETVSALETVLADVSRAFIDRQTIEAGVKEGKSVLQMHHFKVRSAAGLVIQELLTAFAANFILWAAEWFQQNDSTPGPLARAQASVKQSVRIVANTSAWVIWQFQGCLLRFTDHSPFAGVELPVGTTQLPLPLFKSCVSGPI